MRPKNTDAGTLALLATVITAVVLAGCLGGNNTSGPGSGNGGGISADATQYAKSQGQGTLTLWVDSQAQQYNYSYVVSQNVSGQPASTVKRSVNFTLQFACRISAQVLYNYTAISQQGDTSTFISGFAKRESGSVVAQNTSIPETVFTSYDVTNAVAKVYNQDQSQTLGSCNMNGARDISYTFNVGN
ncbi:MAG: hypothetical protein SV186_04380 [Candidatus Nanohaloarchaea archaeon]|nr:hypothetical protein [Candidatus Nanohaloarchaea archaeon]